VSNQNKGADAKSCPWCDIAIAAHLAVRIDPARYPPAWRLMIAALNATGKQLQRWLTFFHPTDCPGCLDSARMQRGDHLGPERRAWRAAMWESNPTMHGFMKRGPGDTFEEVRT
jgi:hypothetical protein